MHDNPPRMGRLALLYIGLGAILCAVILYVGAAGRDVQAQPSIAGGYDVAGPPGCLGASFDVAQSGQFISITGTGDVGGKMRLANNRLTGDVACRDGSRSALQATVSGDGALGGTAGGQRFVAELHRDPPKPGARTRTPGAIAGDYKLSPRSDCLGSGFALESTGGRGLELVASKTKGELTYANGMVAGAASCAKGGRVEIAGEAVNRRLTLTVGDERLVADKEREFGHLLARLFIAIAIIMLAARLAGAAVVKLGQPRVMGEVLAGIALGPTLLGRFVPEVQAALFPEDVIPFIGAAANLGLIFYMFLVGLELDFSRLKGRVAQTAAVSNASVILPMAVGLLIALPIYELVAPDTKFIAFALFMGVSMSITAFPVLARILEERRMLKRPVGALVLASAAVDDVTAWFLIALASAVATAASFTGVVRTVALAVAFCVAMVFVARPLLARVSVAYEEAGRVPLAWIAAIFAGVLVSAYATETIGIALIFGAFVMGAIMPSHTGLAKDVAGRLEDFVVILLLPLFFAYTGLRTNVGLLEEPALFVLTGVLLAVAIFGKFGGAMLAARTTGLGWRASSVIGALMNTRGLTELIVLNLALEKGVISEALFAALVVMALVTTFMAGPLLKLFDPMNTFGSPVADELEPDATLSEIDLSRPLPGQAILVVPQTDAALEQLVAVAEPLADSDRERELILARLVAPPAALRPGPQSQTRLCKDASLAVQRARDDLVRRGIPARAVAFTSVHPGRDLAELAAREEVALVITDGRRPLLGGGVPRGDVQDVLAHAPCDVAVLVASADSVLHPPPGAPVIVPFGGADHDWAAVLLGARMAMAHGVPLQLLGGAGTSESGRDSSRLIAHASLALQRTHGIFAEPLIAEPGLKGLMAALDGAGLLVIGLSDRWRDEGLGATRTAIARANVAPVLFVRSGERPGPLKDAEGPISRVGWSLSPTS